jgi:DNA-binding transcriptional LysR family regulator
MELSDLTIFLAVASRNGITKAAQDLHTVQSNISARIQSLEKELGVALFRRHARGVTLTGAGEQLVPYAQRITKLVDEAHQIVGDESDPCGPLRLGSLETTAGLRLPAVLAAFTADCPKVDLSLMAGPTDALIRDVLDYRLDGALVTGPVRHPDLVGTMAFVERLVLVTARWVTGLGPVLREPGEHRILVFRSGCSYRRRLENLLLTRGAAGVRALEFGTLEGILGCVGAGMGITLLPAGVVETHVERGQVRVHELPEEEGRAETLFVRRADTPSSPALSRFLSHVRAVGEPLVLRIVEPLTHTQ